MSNLPPDGWTEVIIDGVQVDGVGPASGHPDLVRLVLAYPPATVQGGAPAPVDEQEQIAKLEAERDQLAAAVTNARYVAEVIEANGLHWAADSIRRALDGTLGSAALFRVTDHTYEGTPSGQCEAERFGRTCDATWEQHELRDDGAVAEVYEVRP
jgi:hypothetical protein